MAPADTPGFEAVGGTELGADLEGGTRIVSAAEATGVAAGLAAEAGTAPEADGFGAITTAFIAVVASLVSVAATTAPAADGGFGALAGAAPGFTPGLGREIRIVSSGGAPPTAGASAVSEEGGLTTVPVDPGPTPTGGTGVFGITIVGVPAGTDPGAEPGLGITIVVIVGFGLGGGDNGTVGAAGDGDGGAGNLMGFGASAGAEGLLGEARFTFKVS